MAAGHGGAGQEHRGPGGIETAQTPARALESDNKLPPLPRTVHAHHCVLEGLSPRSPAGDRVYDVMLVVRIPWASFAAPMKVKVISNDGRTLRLEVAEDWYVPRVGIGRPKGSRFTQSIGELGKCGTVYATVS